MIRKIIYILVFFGMIFIGSCSKLSEFNESEPEKLPIVVEGILMPDSEPVVWLSELSNTDNIEDTTNIPVNNAKVTLFYNGVPYDLPLFDAKRGEYRYEGDALKILAGETYNLKVDYLGKRITAETNLPYSVRNISAVVEADRQNDTLAFLNISWERIDNSYFYLFIESDTANVSESYCRYSEYPFVNNYFIIDTTGLHEGDIYYIIIYSLQANYVQYYFSYDPLNSSYNYESNILGAYGIFTGLNVGFISFEYRKDLNVKLQVQSLPSFMAQSFLNTKK